MKSLIVIWFVNENNEEEIVTAYWRRNKNWENICQKCGIEARETILQKYEYEEGIPLRDVPTYECPKCGEFVFTEQQVEDMERKTDLIKSEPS